MSLTSKGVPYPLIDDPNQTPANLEALAGWINEHPGITACTTSVRDLLNGLDIWAGRVIFNTTTGRLEVNQTGTPGAGAWTPLAEQAHTHNAGDVTAGIFALARLPVAASGTVDATKIVRADDSRLANARTPTAHVHNASDVNAGVLALARIPVAASGASSSTAVVRADDSRLSDARTPTAHQHDAGDVNAGVMALARLPVAGSGTNSSTQLVRADDSRLADARTPTAHQHNASDVNAGVLALARIPVAASGTVDATKVVRADDSRLANARTPTGAAGGKLSGSYPNPTLATGGVGAAEVGADIIPSGSTVGGTAGTAAAGTPALRALGTTSSTAAAGNDARLSDARTPTAHTHAAADTTSGVFSAARLPAATETAIGAAERATTAEAAAGTDPTRYVSPAGLKAAILALAYPVGTIYESVNNVSPATFLGGTWVAWGAGRAPVGVDTGQTEFNAVEKTGGAKTHTLTTAEMPNHTHTYEQGWNEVASPNWNITNGSGRAFNTGVDRVSGSAGGGGAHNNLQPYITRYAWKRTA